MQFSLKWKAEFKRIDEACIKPLPFEYGSIKYDPDSILRYVEIANAHHHKWGYPKTKKCVACLLDSIALFSSPFCFAGIISMLPILYWSAFWLFTSWFIEEQSATLLPAFLKTVSLVCCPFIVGHCNQHVSDRLNINIDYVSADGHWIWLALLSFAFGAWFAIRACLSIKTSLPL